MRRFIRIPSLLILLLFSFPLLVGCEGPQGPQGPEGPEGPVGPAGEKGTANVVYSSWIDVTWDGGGAYGRYMNISESRVTEDFLNTGAIQMYLKFENSNGSFITPLSFIDGNHELHCFAALSSDPQQPSNGIILQLDHVAGQPIEQNAIDYFADQEVRYVLIPGGVAAKSMMSIEEIKEMPYHMIKKHFGIRD